MSGGARALLAHQGAHLLWLLLLGAGLGAASRLEGFRAGSWLGVSTDAWILLAAGDAVAHQVYVWLCWRLELHGGHLTRVLGNRAFPLYASGFTVLIAARPVLITALAISNAGTLPIDPTLAPILGILVALPALATFYSVKRWFSRKRAFGIDHFDPSYRGMPLVKKGMFRFSSNSMYVFGFLVLYTPGLVTRSMAAIAVALFSHAYIWVHYSCTEKPDMEHIYGSSARGATPSSSRSSSEK